MDNKVLSLGQKVFVGILIDGDEFNYKDIICKECVVTNIKFESRWEYDLTEVEEIPDMTSKYDADHVNQGLKVHHVNQVEQLTTHYLVYDQNTNQHMKIYLSFMQFMLFVRRHDKQMIYKKIDEKINKALSNFKVEVKINNK